MSFFGRLRMTPTLCVETAQNDTDALHRQQVLSSVNQKKVKICVVLGAWNEVDGLRGMSEANLSW
jgi:hypothetical protein